MVRVTFGGRVVRDVATLRTVGGLVLVSRSDGGCEVRSGGRVLGAALIGADSREGAVRAAIDGWRRRKWLPPRPAP